VANPAESSEVRLTVDVEDVLPIIKRSLYSERDIFLRELISNGIDALKKIGFAGHANDSLGPDGMPLHVAVSVDRGSLTLSVADNGIGMSREEVIRNINQIAFSGAREFIKQHSDAKQELIGRFGIGFYSTFAVSTLVRIETMSAVPDGGPTTVIGPTTRKTNGTKVTCLLAEEAEEFLNIEKVEQIIRRYFDYAPYPVVLEGRQINVIAAPWHLTSADRQALSREQYSQFYDRLNPGENMPLGWLHVESDSPIQVRALLFLPDRDQSQPGKVRMFADRIFVCDNLADLLPPWLAFLDGVVDSPDLPINVARERFQSDRRVAALRKHLTNRTLALLEEMVRCRYSEYVRVWERYSIALKAGCLDAAIHEQLDTSTRLEKLLLFSSTRGGLTGLGGYLERCRESEKSTFVYCSNPAGQGSHLELHRNRNREVLLLLKPIDALLISTIEKRHPEWTFLRADETGAVRGTAEAQTPGASWDELIHLFADICQSRANRVVVEALPSADIPALLNASQVSARQEEFGMLRKTSKSVAASVLVLNSNSLLMRRLRDACAGGESNDMIRRIVEQVWDTTLLDRGLLDHDQLRAALRRQRDFLLRAIECTGQSAN
jgi:molecular chaperone HtpG